MKINSPYLVYSSESIRARLKELRNLAREWEMCDYSSYRNAMRLIEHWEVELTQAEERESTDRIDAKGGAA